MAKIASGFILIVLMAFPFGVHAASIIESYEFPSREFENRYYSLIEEFRCPKCLNTNLAGSDAPIAEDLRRAVYRLMIDQQMSDADIRSFLQSRYGDFVLYDPPFRMGTLLLWLGPAIFLSLGFYVFFRVLRQVGRSKFQPEDSARIREFFGE